MDCPNCGSRMIQADLEQLQGEKLFFTLECPQCHFRKQVVQKKIF